MRERKQKKKKIRTNLLIFVLTTVIILGSIPAMTTHAATTEDLTALRAMLLEMLETGDGSRHYVYDWNLKFTDYNPIWEDVIANEGKLAYRCYLNNVIQTDKDSNGTVINIYTFNADAGFPERYAKVKDFLANAHEQMEGMTDLDKLIWVNDYLVEHVYYYLDPDDDMVRTLSGPLTMGYAVCSGYAEAMQVILENEGIEVELVSNSTHEWIAVAIDGKKYHIDPTWNDTRSGSARSIHYFLMRNDDEFLNTLSTKHAAWQRWSTSANKNEFYTISTSTDYTNWYVHDVMDQMHYYKGMWYYVKDGSIFKNNAKGTALSEVVSGTNLKIEGITKGVLVYTQGTQTIALDLKESGNAPATTCTHTNTEIKNAVAAGCKNAGYTGDTYCVDCGVLLKKGSQIKKLSHNWDNGVVTKQPTANNKGKKLYTCSSCKSTKTEYLDKLDASATCGHSTLVSKNAKTPTCTEAGKNADIYCADCGLLIETGATIKAINHRWNNGVITKEPTETETGIKTYSCNLCHETKMETLEKSGSTKPAVPEETTAPAVPTDQENPTDDTNKTIDYNKIFTDSKTGHWYQFVKTNTTVSVMFIKPSDKTKGTVTIPAKISVDGKYYKVTVIANNACKGNEKVTKITIGSNVTSIGRNAFYGCKKLKNITIKTTKLTSKKVGSKAFKGISPNAAIKVPKSKLSSYKKILKAKGVGTKVKVKA